jgi:DNA-binding NtrC family response regulator
MVPPLRTRKEDLPQLVEAILQKIELPGIRIAPEAMTLLDAYDWPGNVRELKNTVSMIAASGWKNTIRAEHLPLKILNPPRSAGRDHREMSLAAIEKNHIAAVLQQTSYNYSQASLVLGISRSSLYRKMAEFDLEKK